MIGTRRSFVPRRSRWKHFLTPPDIVTCYLRAFHARLDERDGRVVVTLKVVFDHLGVIRYLSALFVEEAVSPSWCPMRARASDSSAFLEEPPSGVL